MAPASRCMARAPDWARATVDNDKDMASKSSLVIIDGWSFLNTASQFVFIDTRQEIFRSLFGIGRLPSIGPRPLIKLTNLKTKADDGRLHYASPRSVISFK